MTDKFTESFRGRVIEIWQDKESEEYFGHPCWVGSFTDAHGVTFLVGSSDSFEKAQRELHERVSYDIEEQDIAGQFKQLVNQLEARGFSRTLILDGFSTSLHEENWHSKILIQLENAVNASRDN